MAEPVLLDLGGERSKVATPQAAHGSRILFPRGSCSSQQGCSLAKGNVSDDILTFQKEIERTRNRWFLENENRVIRGGVHRSSDHSGQSMMGGNVSTSNLHQGKRTCLGVSTRIGCLDYCYVSL
jgi:hypothetical protein